MSDTQNKRIDEIEDQIETLEGQLTSVRKVTPLHDATWYVKWISVFFMLCDCGQESVGTVPHMTCGLVLVGTVGWAMGRILWHDRALIVLNAILLAHASVRRLMRYYCGHMSMIKKNYFTTGQMRNALIQIEDKMVHSNWMPTVILGINRGGCIPGVYLSHRLKVATRST